MDMKVVVFLCMSLAACTQARTVRQAADTASSSTPPPAASTPAPTPAPSSAAPPASTAAPETSSAKGDSSSNVTSTSEQPTLTEEQYYHHILESAKKGLATFTLQFQKFAFNATAPGKNTLFSPVNIAGILATLLLGAEGQTKAEILKAVGISTGKDLSHKENQIHLALGSLFENFTTEALANPATKVEIAQSIFLQKDTVVKDFFRNFSQTVYKNEIVDVDFSSPTSEAADVINKWIDNKTHHRIEHLVDAPLSKSTKMILSNTLFFNGEWEFPFLNETCWKPFHTDAGNYQVKMMANVGEVYLLREMGRNYSALGVPYKGGKILMYFILPKKGHTLKEVITSLTSEDLHDITTKSQKVEDLTYEIPFMSINDQIQLNGILESIGIKSVFDAAHANLSNIADNLFVSQIIHKANLDVTEAGSTGSASTVAQIENKFGKEPFIANQPFISFVHHRSSGLISFWATVNLPVPNKVAT